MEYKQFKNKKITIMGLGLHGGGTGAARFFAEAGAKVLVTDLKSRQDLEPSLKKLKGLKIKFVLGQHRPEDFTAADLIIKNPAVPNDSKYLKIAKDNAVKIDTDVGIFFKLCPAPIIGITGTKGKSTTATLTFKMLKTKYDNVILAGNIRNSVLAKLTKIKPESSVVLELSSWQLEGLKKHRLSPAVALITNILPDHLNRYQDMPEYLAAKKLIFLFQKPNNHLILNYDDPTLKQVAREAKSKVVFFSSQTPAPAKPEYHFGAWLDKNKIVFGPKTEEIMPVADIKLLGSHNLSNILGAVTIAKLYKINSKNIRKTIKSFKGLDGRMQLIAEKNRIIYINDTCATMPDATVAGLRNLPNQKIILLAGGADKQLDFKELAQIIPVKVKHLILFKGDGSLKLHKELKQCAPNFSHISMADSMAKAVAIAKSQAQTGDIVLLSPACASFGLFQHEFDRGDKFNQAVLKS